MLNARHARLNLSHVVVWALELHLFRDTLLGLMHARVRAHAEPMQQGPVAEKHPRLGLLPWRVLVDLLAQRWQLALAARLWGTM